MSRLASRSRCSTQRLHRRIVAIELAQLDRQALAQVSRAHARRIELLQHRDDFVDRLLRRTEPLGGLAEIGRQVAGVVDQVDQILPDHALRRRRECHGELFGEVIGERQLGGHEGFEIVFVVAGGATTPFGIDRRRRVLRGARGGFGRLFGEHVVEPGIERLLDLGAGAEVAVQPFLLAGLKGGLAARACGHVGRLAVVSVARGTIGIAVVRPLHSRLARHRRFRPVGGPLEQRIALQLFLDKGRQIQVRQLQQLDRLHQLRRHHQRLRLAEL
ncbi:hypothetical protein ACVWW1_006390 [Bradyrhizobium sp. JR3.5]